MKNPLLPVVVLGRLMVLLAILSPVSGLHAATYHWGGGTGNIGGTGTPAGGTGTWNITTQNWTLNSYSTNGSGYVAWPNLAADNAVFGGTAGTVTVGTSVTLSNLAVDTSNYIFTIGGNITLTLSSFSGAGLSSSTFQATSGSRILIFSGSGSTTYSGSLKNGGGTLTFRLGSNRELSLTGTNSDYTGPTQLYGGQLNISSIADGGVNSSIGASSSAAANLAFGNSTAGVTLNYVGSGGSTDRLFTLTGTAIGVNHKILNNGSGALSFTNTGAMVHAGTVNQARTFTLGGTNTNNNTFAVQLTNNGTGALSLVKADAGKWIMTGNNTFSGDTTVSGGRLVVNGTNANSAVTVSNGATLAGSGQVGAVTVNGTIAPGNSVGTLSAGSTVFNPDGAFELEIYNWTGSAGTGWDLLNITGDLTLSNTSGSPFTINLVSMSSTNTAGLSINFDASQSFTNVFATYSGSLLGNAFAANMFTVNTNSFQNPFSGTFSITNVAGGLALLYTAGGPISTTFVWNAGAGAWSSGANWTNGTAPSNGDAIEFAGSGGSSTNNQVTSITGLAFKANAGSYGISGNTFTNGSNGIVNSSSNAQTISNGIVLGASQSFSAAGGNLILHGAVDLSTNDLTVVSAADTTMSGDISGSGQITKTGAGTLTLSGSNSYSGQTTVSTGTLVATHGSALGATNGGTVVASGAQLQLNATNGGFTIGNEALSIAGSGVGGTGALHNAAGNNTYQGKITLTNATTIHVANGSSLTFDVASGNAIEGSNVMLTFDGSGTNRVNDAISLGTGRLIKQGDGVLVLAASNSFSGGTVISNGTIVMADNGAFGSGILTNTTGGALHVQGSRMLSNNLVLSNSSTIAGTGSLNVTGTVSIQSTVNLTNEAVGGLTFGNVELGNSATARTLVLHGTANTTFSGTVANSSAGNIGALDIRSSGLTALNASNSYSGNTIIRGSAGEGIPGATVRLGNAHALGDTAGYTQVNLGGQLDLNGHAVVGEELRLNGPGYLGAGALVNSSAGTASWSGLVTLSSASTITTTNGRIAISGAVDGAGALTKAGGGTLTLSASNSYTGTTTVSGGVLELASATGGAAGATTDVVVSTGAVLLISQDEQVNNSAAVSLSGGTITLSGEVSETFGNLTMTDSSFLNFGSTQGDHFIKFGSLTLNDFTLGISNFVLGNQLQYSAADYAAGEALASTFSFTSSADRGFSFNEGVFTITAIPEPSAVVAAVGLLGLCLWPMRKRLLARLSATRAT